MKLTAEQVYQKLLEDFKIYEVTGQIKFYLGDVDIIVKARDVVGNIMQEWLEGWLRKNDIEYKPNENTQMPPDVFLNPDDTTVDLLEVKAFNYEASPGFDIADFNAFQTELIREPYMVHTKYLIFGYVMQEDGFAPASGMPTANEPSSVSSFRLNTSFRPSTKPYIATQTRASLAVSGCRSSPRVIRSIMVSSSTFHAGAASPTNM